MAKKKDSFYRKIGEILIEGGCPDTIKAIYRHLLENEEVKIAYVFYKECMDELEKHDIGFTLHDLGLVEDPEYSEEVQKRFEAGARAREDGEILDKMGDDKPRKYIPDLDYSKRIVDVLNKTTADDDYWCFSGQILSQMRSKEYTEEDYKEMAKDLRKADEFFVKKVAEIRENFKEIEKVLNKLKA